MRIAFCSGIIVRIHPFQPKNGVLSIWLTIIIGRKITERNDLGLHNLKYARNDQQSPEACEVDSSRAPHSVIQSSTASFPAGPRRSFTTQDSHITHPKAATDAFQVAITGSQIEAETLPCPQSTSLVAQQVPRVDFTQPACMQLGYQAQNGAEKVCDIDPDHSYSPGSDRDPNLISTFRLDKTAPLQKIDKKHKLSYRRISVACGKSLCRPASNEFFRMPRRLAYVSKLTKSPYFPARRAVQEAKNQVHCFS